MNYAIIFGTFALAIMITHLKGPFNIFGGIRDVYKSLIESTAGPKSHMLDAIKCTYCVSFWLILIADLSLSNSFFLDFPTHLGIVYAMFVAFDLVVAVERYTNYFVTGEDNKK